MHFQSVNIAATLRGLLDVSKKLEIPLRELRIKQPNLEELFLKVTGETMRSKRESKKYEDTVLCLFQFGSLQLQGMRRAGNS